MTAVATIEMHAPMVKLSTKDMKNLVRSDAH